jgi:hypothetical protein
MGETKYGKTPQNPSCAMRGSKRFRAEAVSLALESDFAIRRILSMVFPLGNNVRVIVGFYFSVTRIGAIRM